MVLKSVAPYGDWESELSIEAVTEGSRSLVSPRVDRTSGRAFFLESRPDGSNSIVEVTSGGQTRHVLPASASASTTVYEYGDLPYAVVPGDPLRIVFSDARDQSLCLLDVDAGRVRRLVQSPTLRYADFDPQPGGSGWVLAVEEDHARPRPADVRNYVVAVHLATGEVRRVLEGADFYAYPRFSPDGTKVVWKEWDHPNLPIYGAKLFWGDWDDGRIVNVELISGTNGESPTQPRWSPGGVLFFAQETSGFRQLFRRGREDKRPAAVELRGQGASEISDAWVIGWQTYVFLTETTLVAAPATFGAHGLAHIDLATATWTPLESHFADLRSDCLASLSPYSLLVAGSGAQTPEGVYRVVIAPDMTVHSTLLRSSVDTTYPPDLFSKPEHITFPIDPEPGAPSRTTRTVHAFFWPPHNPRFAAPEGTLPPLLVTPHGGPTAHATPGLKLEDQYYTSRGYAVLAVNYTGSTGHGRAYRDALFGRWGVADRDDVAGAARQLVARGRVDGSRVGIVGGSAGGYNVLQCLCWHADVFAGGVSLCGVADVAALARETHKLESRYTDVLMGSGGLGEAEREALFRARSPLYHAGQIRAPLLLVHGDGDTVVPIAQSREIRRRVREAGGDVELVTLEGEGHVFKRAESRATVLREGERWWRKTLLRREGGRA